MNNEGDEFTTGTKKGKGEHHDYGDETNFEMR